MHMSRNPAPVPSSDVPSRPSLKVAFASSSSTCYISALAFAPPASPATPFTPRRCLPRSPQKDGYDIVGTANSAALAPAVAKMVVKPLPGPPGASNRFEQIDPLVKSASIVIYVLAGREHEARSAILSVDKARRCSSLLPAAICNLEALSRFRMRWRAPAPSLSAPGLGFAAGRRPCGRRARLYRDIQPDILGLHSEDAHGPAPAHAAPGRRPQPQRGARWPGGGRVADGEGPRGAF